ncbi:MAG: hypothetical protein ABSE48_09905 [Verrucomicrobiota bacterium]|jgi:hypothetical protein
MKKINRSVRWMLSTMAVSCVLCMAFPARVAAEVSDADFNALKELVQQMNGKLQALEQTNQTDQQTIDALKQKLSETQQTASDAERKSVAAVQAETQPPAQAPIDEATVNHNFMMLGDAEFQYVNADKQHGAFALADFAPIFLYRGGDNILFEAGFDTTLANNSPNGGGYTTTFNLSFAQLDYIMNDYMTLCVGQLLLPLGTYAERGAGWLNKFPDDPLAVDALLPESGAGVELRGAVPWGDEGKFINYAAYVVNGPGSSTNEPADAGDLDLGGNVGVRSDGVFANLHNSPAGGGRLGVFLPFPYKPHYDLELGISGQTGEWDNGGNHLWTAGVLDAALHLGPNFEAKAEAMMTRYGTDDLGLIRTEGWYTQVGYKLAGLNFDIPILNDIELVGRYDSLVDGIDPTVRRYSLGYIYYITNTLLFEGDYEFIHTSDPTQPATQLILQLSYGF